MFERNYTREAKQYHFTKTVFSHKILTVDEESTSPCLTNQTGDPPSMKNLKAQLFRQCPKTGKVVGFQPLKRPLIWLYPFIGLFALIWFLARVVPKPSRASYPCQRLALPLASTFVLWVLGAVASTLSFRWRGFLVNGALCLAIGALALSGGDGRVEKLAQASYTAHPPNAPVGVARGFAPGRVAWVHNPDVTDWAGPGSGQRWYEHVNQAIANDMFSWALRGYTNQASDAAAWEAIFRHYNGGAAYQPGEKIYIKINLTTANAGGAMADDSYNQLVKSGVTLDSTANSPQLMHALLDQLVNGVGVAQADITIGDPTGLWVNYLYSPLHADFPNVRYEDNRGGTGPEGESTRRARAEYTSPCVPYYWSTSEANGKTQDCALVSLYDAAYVINFSVLKSHDRSGITVAAKNNYGSMLRTPIGGGRTLGSSHYNLHDRLPLQPTNTAWQNMGYYRPLVDLMGNKYIGGKTVLYLVDGLFGGKGWNSVTSTWDLAPFNGDWPSSLFLSMDAVALDSVAFDFMSQKWPEYVLAYEGVQDYLHEAALANNPPSGACYDPERDGVCLGSLGVHEHWNNAVDKKYTRNLGTGDGIELRYIASDPTAANLVSFNTAGGTQSIRLTWRSAQEIDLSGFNLYRAESMEGRRVQLNPNLIPAKTPGQMLGNDYQYDDASAEPGRFYHYWVEWVGASRSSLSEPVTAARLAAFKLNLPVVLK
jgi:hypothetical protein